MDKSLLERSVFKKMKNSKIAKINGLSQESYFDFEHIKDLSKKTQDRIEVTKWSVIPIKDIFMQMLIHLND